MAKRPQPTATRVTRNDLDRAADLLLTRWLAHLRDVQRRPMVDGSPVRLHSLTEYAQPCGEGMTYTHHAATVLAMARGRAKSAGQWHEPTMALLLWAADLRQQRAAQ